MYIVYYNNIIVDTLSQSSKFTLRLFMKYYKVSGHAHPRILKSLLSLKIMSWQEYNSCF